MRGRSRLLTGDDISFSRRSVTIAVSSAPGVAGARPTGTGPAQPEVIPVGAEDGKIDMITVRCTCGREITITCDYAQEGGEDE